MARKEDNVLSLLLVIFLCACVRNGGADNITTYRLGFLAPSPDSSIPSSLAIEWSSAFQVALEVLNAENRTYQLVSSPQNTECDWQQGQLAAEMMVTAVVPALIGAVGPACSDAAMSAARTFLYYNYTLISFAATSELLSSRGIFQNFFRTVFSDKHQAAAIAASVAKLGIKKVTLLYVQKYYSMSLATSINETVSSYATVRLHMLDVGDNSTVNSTQLGIILDSVANDEFVIMAVQPLQAYDIWSAARSLNKLRYPYWYFGSDGVTAFDPVDTNVTDPDLVNALQGEIGVAPDGGNILNNTHCEKFYSYWKAKNYTGFPSEGKNRTRSYVPHLIDAVQTYYVIIDNLIKSKMPVTQQNIFSALNGSGPGVPQFEGCSGTVSFDPTTGSRSVVTQVPGYDLVALTSEYWEIKGQIENTTVQNLQVLQQPGSEFGPNSTYIGPNPNGMSSKTKAGIIAGTLAAVVATLALLGGAVYLYRRRPHNQVSRSESMSRIIEYMQK